MKSNVEVSIWLSNIDPPRCLRLFEATAVETIITTQCIHHIPVRGWCWKVVNVTHADCVCVWGGGGSPMVSGVSSSTDLAQSLPSLPSRRSRDKISQFCLSIPVLENPAHSQLVLLFPLQLGKELPLTHTTVQDYYHWKSSVHDSSPHAFCHPPNGWSGD
jgi:hypothetical protein